MDIVVKGRKTEVPERFREHVAEKLERIQKFDGKVISLDVELSKERNPRQADRSDRVEITAAHRGPVIRAEAAAATLRGARPGLGEARRTTAQGPPTGDGCTRDRARR